MARLKLRELLGCLVKPEEDHKSPVPLQRSTPAGFTMLQSLSQPPAVTAFIPVHLQTTPIKPSASLHVTWLRPGVIVP